MTRTPVFIPFIMKKTSDLAAWCLEGDSTYHGHWIYEKLHKPSSAFHEAVNVLYYLLNRPKLHRPISALIEPVYGCNLNCTYCWSAFNQSGLPGPLPARPRLMPWQLFRQAVGQLPGTVESVCLTGLGEPLLHPDLVKMIEYLSSRHIRTIIYSNGTLLHGPLADRLACSPVNVVNLSIEPDSESAMTYRGVDMRTLYRNIAAFIRKKRPETEVKLTVVAHSGNADRLKHATRQWQNQTDGIKIVNRVSFDKPVPPHKCPEPWLGNINIFTNGDVGICCLALAWPIVIGNITSKPLNAIINSSRHQEILRSFIDKKNLPAPCHFCLQFDARKPERISRRFLK